MVDRKLIFTGIGAAAALGLCVGVGSQLWQGRDGSSENSVDPTNIPVLPTVLPTSTQQIATPTSESGNNNAQQSAAGPNYTGPCWSLPGLDGKRVPVEIGQASRYWNAVCIGVEEDGATHWWFEGHESITYPFAPESPTAIR